MSCGCSTSLIEPLSDLWNRSRGDSVREVLDTGLFYMLPMVFNMTGSIFILATQFGTAIIIVVLFTSAAYVSVVNISKQRTAELRLAWLDQSDNKAAIKNESISNVELLKYFCMEPYEIARYRKSLLRTQKADWNYYINNHTIQLLEEAIQVSGGSPSQ